MLLNSKTIEEARDFEKDIFFGWRLGRTKEYSQFVEISRLYSREIKDPQQAMNCAIDYCIEHGILEEIMRRNRSRILGSLLEDFDKEKYERTLVNDAKKEERNRIILNLIRMDKDDTEIITITGCTNEDIDIVRSKNEI